jgi:predicted short-subunit dehydrogenase-like oxidoreductase (DUF2520 family)
MKHKLDKIVLLGAGNVATALAKALAKKHNIVQVYSRSNNSANKLAKIIKCSYTNKLSEITPDADLYIIAVTDDAIEKVALQLKLKNKTVIHTSGSIDKAVLKKASFDYGVLWPLQTFSKGSVINQNTPFVIDTSTKQLANQLNDLVKEMNGKSIQLNSEKKAKLHLAAVFANNFTNHLYGVAYDILKKEKISFDVLLPLINETIEKIKEQDPRKIQTGPAIRGDKKTIKNQEAILSANPQYLELYKLLTKSIQLTTHAKKL